MIDRLDQAAITSADPPDVPDVQTTSIRRTGRPGRPRIEIDRDVLATALEMRGPTGLAPVFGVSARTVRRNALRQGLVEPGEPVYRDVQAPDGSTERVYTSSTAPATDIEPEALDQIVREILSSFPTYGRRMLRGHLSSLGYRIPRPQLEASYLRVHGPPAAHFGPRRIERRVYSVPGPNSLWHHDGQHGRYFIRIYPDCCLNQMTFRSHSMEDSDSWVY